MKVIILGCGRTGSQLAKKLALEGHQVTIIDNNLESFAILNPDLKCRQVVGTGFDEDVLLKAGIEKADAFIAMTNQDNANLMATQVAKYSFKVSRVICRLDDPKREDIYRSLGLETISHTQWEVSQIDEFLKNKV